MGFRDGSDPADDATVGRAGRHAQAGPGVDPRHGRYTLVPAAYVFLLRGPAAAPGGRPAPRTQVLLQLRRNTGWMDGHWAAAAAGHVEPLETAYDAARREASEELGIVDLALHHEVTMQRTGSRDPLDQRVDFYFSTRSWSGEPRRAEPDKAAELRWVALEALDSLGGPVVPYERRVLEGLGSGEGFLLDGF